MSAAWVFLRPLDVVSFRDGRPFSAGLTSTARSTLPRPTSTGGAIKTVFGTEPVSIEGPVLVDPTEPATLLLPAPADLVVDEHTGSATRLHPDNPDASTPPGVVTDLDPHDAPAGGAEGLAGKLRLLYGEGEPVAAYLPADTLGRYLQGDPSDALEAVAREAAGSAGPGGLTPFVRERRVGLARHSRSETAGRTAVTGFFYLAEFLRVPDTAATVETSIGFACRVTFEGDVPEPRSRIVKLGGEGRQAEVTVRPIMDGDRFGLPAPPVGIGGDSDDGGGDERDVVLYLATPAVFADGWMPPVGDGTRIMAACVSGPEAVASWAPERNQPRPLRWAVGAGSVYFLRFADGPTASTFVADWHGRCLPQAHDRLRTVGFGLCLTGKW